MLFWPSLYISQDCLLLFSFDVTHAFDATSLDNIRDSDLDIQGCYRIRPICSKGLANKIMPFAQARYKGWCELQQKVIQLQKEHEEEDEQLQQQLDESAKERSVSDMNAMHKMVQLLCMDILHTHKSFPLLTTCLLHAMSSADFDSAIEMPVGLCSSQRGQRITKLEAEVTKLKSDLALSQKNAQAAGKAFFVYTSVAHANAPPLQAVYT